MFPEPTQELIGQFMLSHGDRFYRRIAQAYLSGNPQQREKLYQTFFWRFNAVYRALRWHLPIPSLSQGWAKKKLNATQVHIIAGMRSSGENFYDYLGRAIFLATPDSYKTLRYHWGEEIAHYRSEWRAKLKAEKEAQDAETTHE